MALRFIDPDTTGEVEVAGVKFTVGFWPPRESERFAGQIEQLRKAADPASPEAMMLALDVHRGMVQYGVRGWTGWEGAPEAVIAEETIHGRKHKKLDDRLLDGLSLNGALEALALECLRWNNLTTQEKKTPARGEPEVPGAAA